MIFICLGSREYQFNRLLKEVDKLITNGHIKESVVAQIGESTYIPNNYEYRKYLNIDEFNEYQIKADLIISHGGTGALVGALKKEKKVIAVPRLEKYGEHIDNHQTEVASILQEEGYLYMVTEIEKLSGIITLIQNSPLNKKYKHNSNAYSIITNYLKSDT